ncbi:MAG TPA: hypothetical protein VLX32_13635 [Candidatus Acidoferrum sp.]|nr:hypothetical protein [Candidatus Acidoferrum sp.]
MLLQTRFFRFGSVNTLPVALALAALSFAPAVGAAASGRPQDEITRNFEKTVTLSGNQGLSLDHRLGHVHVTGVAGHDAKISATIHVQSNSQSDSQNFADKIQIDVSQSSDGVHVKTIYPEETRRWFSSSGRVSFSVDYEISMPADAPLWLRNDFGDTDISGVHGWMQARNGHGAMSVQDAGAAKLANSFGKIDLATASGNCEVTNNNGTVSVSGVKGSLNIRNRFGEIKAAQIGGPTTISGGNGAIEMTNSSGSTDISNSFGTVTVKNLSGGLTVHDSNGRVEVSEISGNTDLTTSFGSVDAQRIGGTLSVNDSNGEVNVGETRGFATVKSSFGTVDARGLHQGARMETGNGNLIVNDIEGDLFAKTSFGSIQAHNIKGSLTAQDSNGSVTAASISGDANVDTSFSGVTLTGVGGKIRVDNQNGGIEITAAQTAGCRDISLKTSFSHILVRVPASAGFKVTAHTSFGQISSELPVTSTGSLGQNSLNGTIGNGACTMDLNNSNGNIQIVKAP